MRKSLRFAVLPLALFILFALRTPHLPAAPAHAADPAAPIRLTLDEREIPTDVAPVIVESRTLVPARAVFEALGGTVEWFDAVTPAEVRIAYADTTVKLVIGSPAALVNDATHTMDVPAQIIGDRTLIPVRFVSESLGFFVRWNDATRTAEIFSPGYDVPPLVASIRALDVTASPDGTRVTITGTSDLSAVSARGEVEPARFRLEIANSFLVATTSALEWQREISVVGGVNAEIGERVTAFTFTLLEDVTPDLVFSDDKTVLRLDFPKPARPFEPWLDGKLVVMLDPGHGAETGGKRSPDGSLLEYAFNRDMAARVRAHLERHGVQVLLSVSDNADLSLDERCRVANESDSDIFVSLHANAFGNGGWSNTNGWEIYVYKKGSYSEQLAEAIHRAVIPASGLGDRGVKAERFYVIRNTNMPAVLIEHGFYTNKDEIRLLKSPDFRERLAIMDARGILEFLGVPWTEPGL